MTLHTPTTLKAGLAALTVLFALAGCGGEENPAGTAAVTSSTSTSASAEAEEHNDADVMFLQMMIPHHAQAIEMSELIVDKDDVDELVVDLAERVIAAQQPEIEQMSGWLETWDEDVPDTGSGMEMDGPMNGMLSQEDVDAIGAATGAEAARLYLEGLKAHHAGAIGMAQSQLEDGMNADVLALAETIIEMQQAEIDEIDELLSSL